MFNIMCCWTARFSIWIACEIYFC